MSNQAISEAPLLPAVAGEYVGRFVIDAWERSGSDGVRVSFLGPYMTDLMAGAPGTFPLRFATFASDVMNQVVMHLASPNATVHHVPTAGYGRHAAPDNAGPFVGEMVVEVWRPADASGPSVVVAVDAPAGAAVATVASSIALAVRQRHSGRQA